MRCLWVAAAITIALCATVRVRAQSVELPRASVHVAVFDCFGTRIKEAEAEVRLRSEDGKQVFSPKTKDDTISGVPYGYYTLTAWDTGGGVTRREVTVNDRDVWFYAGLSFPSGDRLTPPGDLTLTGEIKPAPVSGTWWIRVEGVVLPMRREAPIRKGGAFSIGGLEMGAYLVLVFEGAKLRHAEALELDAKTPVMHLSIPVESAGYRRP